MGTYVYSVRKQLIKIAVGGKMEREQNLLARRAEAVWAKVKPAERPKYVVLVSGKPAGSGGEPVWEWSGRVLVSDASGTLDGFGRRRGVLTKVRRGVWGIKITDED